MLRKTKNTTKDKLDSGLIKNKVHMERISQGKAYPILIKTMAFFFWRKWLVYREDIIWGNVQKNTKTAGRSPITKLDLVNNVKKAGKTVVNPTKDSPKLSKPELAIFKAKFQLWYSSILCS